MSGAPLLRRRAMRPPHAASQVRVCLGGPSGVGWMTGRTQRCSRPSSNGSPGRTILWRLRSRCMSDAPAHHPPQACQCKVLHAISRRVSKVPVGLQGNASASTRRACGTGWAVPWRGEVHPWCTWCAATHSETWSGPFAPALPPLDAV